MEQKHETEERLFQETRPDNDELFMKIAVKFVSGSMTSFL